LCRKLINHLLFTALLFSCEQKALNKYNEASSSFEKFHQDFSIELNSQWVKDESFKINQYCKRHGLVTKITNSGLRFLIIKPSNSNLSPEIGDDVILSYDVRLMDPLKTRCYHSDSNGLAKFKIEQSMVESGLHEVVTYLSKGDSALVILPHFLAHGVTGDSRKIPPLSSVLYYIKLIDVIN
jgi:FKBP-type peptidyl-prolyl cis-trans isomerase